MVYMCAIVFYSKVDNLVISGLEVNGTFLHNFKGYKTLQRSFVINKEEYKEFQDNTGPCNIKELVIHTNKGIFIEKIKKVRSKLTALFISKHHSPRFSMPCFSNSPE